MADLHRLLRILTLPFRPLADLVAHFHRRRPALNQEQAEHEKNLPPLPPPWNSDDRWFRGGFPPRPNNTLTPLLHGDEYFADLIDQLGAARQRITIAGWCMTPLMPLLRDHREGARDSVLAEVLNAASQRAEVYVLLWSGAPAVFQPDTASVEEVQRTLAAVCPKVHCALDHRASFSHDHHQKAVTIDGRVAYIGGIDLTTFQGDRWDTAQHPLRFGPNWHDVQMRIEGGSVQDVEANFCQRWNVVTGDHLQLLPVETPPHAAQSAQVVRTVPQGFYPFAPSGEYGVAHAYLNAIRQAKRFIYLENQYLWSPEVAEALREAMNRAHDGPFRVVLLLPARAYTGKYDNDAHVRMLQSEDRGRGIFSAYSPYAAGPAFGDTGYRYLPIYVHAKVGVVDDEWLTVGSANLNRRGLGTDTEMNVQAVAPEAARALRIRLWAEHLGMTEREIAAGDPCELVDNAWRRVAHQREADVKAEQPPSPAHVIPYKPGTNPGSRALDILQALTLEH